MEWIWTPRRQIGISGELLKTIYHTVPQTGRPKTRYRLNEHSKRIKIFTHDVQFSVRTLYKQNKWRVRHAIRNENRRKVWKRTFQTKWLNSYIWTTLATGDQPEKMMLSGIQLRSTRCAVFYDVKRVVQNFCLPRVTIGKCRRAKVQGTQGTETWRQTYPGRGKKRDPANIAVEEKSNPARMGDSTSFKVAGSVLVC